jgi:hypothetical protein
MLYREVIAVCSEIYTKHTNTVYVELLNVKPGGTGFWSGYVYYSHGSSPYRVVNTHSRL